ncbi:hypothetical protein EDB92DRAFT_1412606 [Lactarius akahatsu]|uniref:Uncharacterized protein n=1 Tax=Lactarius akahatsu TaxID=416441 RepID=A0AAD4LM37_9AGAM|nr:hypothetical protein EDB92DRAFT_1412606 [Lactarius akahatsu]
MPPLLHVYVPLMLWSPKLTSTLDHGPGSTVGASDTDTQLSTKSEQMLVRKRQMDVQAVADSVSAVPSDRVPAGITWLVRPYTMNASYPGACSH